MSTTVSEPKGGDFTRILPPDGLQSAICVDVVDRGEQRSEFAGVVSTKRKISIHWLLVENIPLKTWTHPKTGEVQEVPEKIAGRPYMVQRWYTASLHEKAALRHMLRIWRGREFTGLELEEFDVDDVIGVPCMVTIQYNKSGDNWYANVEGVSRLPKGMDAMKIPSDYVRFKDRPPREGEDQTAGDTNVSEPPPPEWGGVEGQSYDALHSEADRDHYAPDDDSLPF